jgi:hypothetical protein
MAPLYFGLLYVVLSCKHGPLDRNFCYNMQDKQKLKIKTIQASLEGHVSIKASV